MSTSPPPFVRIAVEGPSIDGRHIQRVHLEQAAASYDPNVYGARIWMEHIRGIYPDGMFQAYGDVLALKTRQITLAGQKRLALYAQLAPTQALRELNARQQKCYSSIELLPNFAGTGRAYLIGLAITDTPASIGTEKLAFSQQSPAPDGRLYSPPEELTMSADQENTPPAAAVQATEAAPAPAPSPTAGADAAAPNAFTAALDKVRQMFTRHTHASDAQMGELIGVLEQAAACHQQIEADVSALGARLDTLTGELAAQRQLLSAVPAPAPERPAATGAGTAVLTDC